MFHKDRFTMRIGLAHSKAGPLDNDGTVGSARISSSIRRDGWWTIGTIQLSVRRNTRRDMMRNGMNFASVTADWRSGTVLEQKR